MSSYAEEVVLDKNDAERVDGDREGRFEYGNSAIQDAVILDLKEIGVPVEVYQKFWMKRNKLPKSITDIQVEDSWFQPPLFPEDPECRDLVYVTSREDAEAVAEGRRERAVAKFFDDMAVDDCVPLKDDEIDDFIRDYPDVYEDRAQVASEWMYEYLSDTLDDLLGRHGGRWRVEGDNLTWRGGGGDDVMRNLLPESGVKAKDVLRVLSEYGDGELTLTWREDGGDFDIVVRHHDCPVNGSRFHFVPEDDDARGV